MATIRKPKQNWQSLIVVPGLGKVDKLNAGFLGPFNLRGGS